jgi:hypothetical protein
MSNASEFWRYAEEAMLSARQCKTDSERLAQLNLAHTWTQAALHSEETGATDTLSDLQRPLK